jgi:integrase
VRKAQKAAKDQTENSFEVVARERHVKFAPRWSPVHAETTIKRLERDAFPWIGARPIAEIKAPELLAVLRRVESRGALETAHRVKTICGQVFCYAVATRRAERDPAADLKGALPPATKSHLAAMFFVRPGELRNAEWSEFDLDAGIWSIPAEKMKMKQPHIVPFSSQAVGVLTSLKPLTGRSRYVFPSNRTSLRPMSNNAIFAALRRMGYSKDEMTGHGFRAMARTILDEVLQVRPEFIEHQLAHAVRDPNGRAYNRTTHLEDRKKMMQLWSDYLDGLKVGAKILPFPKMAG